MDGFSAAYRNESAFRQEIVAAAVLLPIACLVPATLTQRALLISALFLVLLTELLNSAIEAAVDRISLADHDFSKRAKDIGSAAVSVSLMNCLVVWVLVLLEVWWPG
ncbi:MAG: diacylglycerol kinase [Gammaproteobacteria bacterium]|nr:diacylglycerol kinase [Gammaproteobacteria bacterium]